jgi:pSer/pThr/pTyr-binding forkhead associated (FHA) protein
MDVRLVVEKGSKKKREIRLKSEDTIIGRRAGCDLRVPSASVSRRHCRLSFRDDCLVVEDLQSANGTYVNGVRITDSQVVQPGDRLEVGPVTFLVKYESAASALPTEKEEIVPEFDMEVLELPEGEEKPAKKRKKTIAEPEGGRKKRDAEPKSGKKKPESEPDEEKEPPPKKVPEPTPQESEGEELPLAFDESTWHMPAGEDIRDILSQMDDSEPQKQ